MRYQGLIDGGQIGSEDPGVSVGLAQLSAAFQSRSPAAAPPPRASSRKESTGEALSTPRPYAAAATLRRSLAKLWTPPTPTPRPSRRR